jgi:hypothetical protein
VNTSRLRSVVKGTSSVMSNVPSGLGIVDPVARVVVVVVVVEVEVVVVEVEVVVVATVVVVDDVVVASVVVVDMATGLSAVGFWAQATTKTADTAMMDKTRVLITGRVSGPSGPDSYTYSTG